MYIFFPSGGKFRIYTQALWCWYSFPSECLKLNQPPLIRVTLSKMQSVLTALVFLVGSCVLAICSEEEHLVPKHGIEFKHSGVKKDLSVEDAELMLKFLLAKLKHGEDTEMIHGKISSGKDHHAYGSEMMDEPHLASMKEEVKYMGKSQPFEYEYMKETAFPVEEDSYEVKKGVSLSEKDMMALMMKMKELTTSKGMEDSYAKESIYESPEGKIISEKSRMFDESPLKEIPGKMLGGEVHPDKFSDKDVSLAESLYHMKIAGDVETYPEIKMESLIEMYNKKMADEKLLLEDAHSLHKENSEESFFKKVDDVGKSLLEEESYPFFKEGNADEYLKKVAAEEKNTFYDPKSTYLGGDLNLEKSVEEKELDAWKASHKDIFADEEGKVLDEKIKIEGTYLAEEGTSLGISGEILKKTKTSLGMDKALTAEHDELLNMAKELHKEGGKVEGSIAYEKAKEQAFKDSHAHLSDEEMKKHIDETLAFGAKDSYGTELSFEKGLAGEKVHDIDAKIGVGIDKSLHGVYGEEVLKSKDVHGLGEAFGFEKDKSFYGGKATFGDEVKHSTAHEIPFAIEDGKAFKFHDDELLKKDKAFHAHESEILKKGKGLETDRIFHEDKEYLETAGDHNLHHVHKGVESHIPHDSVGEKHHVGGAEKVHKVFQDLKAKFLELLARVLRTRKCHLVTMKPAELLGVVNCISKSKDPALCEKFSMCEKKMPFRVITALEKCQLETIPGEAMRCTRYAPLFPSPEIPLKIFQCVALTVGELQPEEKKHMIGFEECAKVIKAESCGRFKWFRGPH